MGISGSNWYYGSSSIASHSFSRPYHDMPVQPTKKSLNFFPLVFFLEINWQIMCYNFSLEINWQIMCYNVFCQFVFNGACIFWPSLQLVFVPRHPFDPTAVLHTEILEHRTWGPFSRNSRIVSHICCTHGHYWAQGEGGAVELIGLLEVSPKYFSGPENPFPF